MKIILGHHPIILKAESQKCPILNNRFKDGNKMCQIRNQGSGTRGSILGTQGPININKNPKVGASM